MDNPISISQFATDDVDHAVEFVTAGFGAHSRITLGRGAFGFGYRALSRSAVAMGMVTRALGQVVRAAAPESVILLHLPLTHESEYRIGRRILRASPNSAVTLSPDHEYSLREPAGRALGLAVKAEALVNALEADWPGRRGHLVLRPVELSLSGGSRAQLLSLWGYWQHIGRLPPARQDPQTVDDLERRLVAWLAGEIANHAGLQPLSPRSRDRVGTLDRWIDAHLAEEIDLARLAAVSGVGPRALAKLCMAARGITPMQLLQARRLAAARRLLVEGGERISVAHVAHECGLGHLGRFAGAYRDAYGEFPSDTLARSRPPDDDAPA